MAVPNIFKFQWNQITRIMPVPCAPSPLLWVETAVPAFCWAFLASQSFDFKELVHISTGKSWLQHVKSQVPVTETTFRQFGRKMVTEDVEVEKVVNSTVGKAGRTFFKFAEGFDMAAYWIFIASIATEGLIEWHSLAYRMAGCRDDVRAGSWSSGSPSGGCGVNAWGGAGYWQVDSGPYSPGTYPFAVIPPGSQGYLAVSLWAHTLLGIPLSVGTRIINQHTGDVYDSHTALAVPGGSAPYSSVWYHHKNYGDNDVVLIAQSYTSPPDSSTSALIGGGQASGGVYPNS